ncbi:unnamed protein product [Phaeothamnion confervicola]
MDVASAYLNSLLTEEIYMKQPEGFERLRLNGQELVCLLQKSLNKAVIQQFQTDITFRMKNLGQLKFLLGMEVPRDRFRRQTEVSRRKYLREILERFQTEQGKLQTTPGQSGQ